MKSKISEFYRGRMKQTNVHNRTGQSLFNGGANVKGASFKTTNKTRKISGMFIDDSHLLKFVHDHSHLLSNESTGVCTFFDKEAGETIISVVEFKKQIQ